MEMTKTKLFFYTVAVLLGITFNACSKDENEVDPELLVSIDQLDITKEGTEKTFILSSNVEWSIEGGQEWCTVSPTSGTSGDTPVKISVSANNSTDQRIATLLIKAADLSEEISIMQAANHQLTLSKNEIELDDQAQEFSVAYEASGSVEVEIIGDWISQKSNSSDAPIFEIENNYTLFARDGSITFTLGDLSETVSITQIGKAATIPSDMTGVESNASTLASKMVAGWNIGNTMEVPKNNGGETGWGNPMVRKTLIDAVKAAGFNAVRIPCAWDSYIVDQTTYRISDTWFTRVKEVVDYCYNNDMYVILNIHWDGGWLEDNPTYDKQEEINKKQEALWQQIAVYFRDYNEKLLFAGTNEVHSDYNTPSTENLKVQQSFNQTFVDAVRATGGKNANRNLIVQTYNTNIAHGVNYHNMPNDVVDNRLMLEVHYYDPWDFCGQTDSGYKSQWGEGYTDVSSWGQEDYLNDQFGSVKTNFVDHGIPVILGEYGALIRSSLTGEALEKHIASHSYYLKTVTKVAKENGMVPFIWDNGYTGNNGFGLFDRNNGSIVHEDAVNAIISGAIE
ncbi:cellulase family glycosylhydrolase [Limibacter armeniacum]|uniref:cellulase family glycosylhydrolase n=1 Tax=Limibacter armeniacum TaxID=466084 RepID=UPI002FE69CE7